MFSYSGTDMMSSLNQNNQQQYSSLAASGGMNGGSNGHSAIAAAQQAMAGMGSQTSAGYGANSYSGGMAGMAAANPSFMTTAASYMSSMQAGQQPGPYSPATQQPQQAGGYGGQPTAAHYQTPVPAQQQQQPAMRAPRSRGESKVPSDAFDGAYQEPTLLRREEVTVEITTDPLNFVCLLKKYFDVVDAANSKLMEAYSSGKDYSIPSSKVRRGMACVAPYEDGGVEQFYRATILNIERNDAEVLFVDYGNVNLVPLSGLKYLPKVCSSVPESYIRCEFDNVTPLDGGSWSEGSLRAFEDYLSMGEFVAEFRGKSKNNYKVELYPAEDPNSPVSAELERRGVLQRGPGQVMSSTSGRGRRVQSRDRDMTRSMSREEPDYRDRRGGRDEIEHRRGGREEPERGTTRSRGRDMTDRASSPSSSAANTELVRAGFKPPTISKKAFTDVKVFQPNTPSKFSCQLLSKREELEAMSEKMSRVYDRGDDQDYLDDNDIIPYVACAVLLETSWQRGYILSSSVHGCQVVMVDTQEVRSVDPDQLRVLREQFLKLPAQGVKCSLDAIICKSNKWTSESCRYFKELVADNEFIAEFRSERGGIWKIMLHSNVHGSDQLVNAMFVVKGWASSTDITVREAVEDINAAKTSPFQMYQVQIGSSLSVSPCHVEGPEEFYVQLTDCEAPITELCEKINEYYSNNSSDKAKLNVDNYCAALWGPEDDDPYWYRARIVSVARNECEVFFIDYGNTDVVENSNIKGLTKQFKQQPMYAVRCRLDGIDPNLMEQMAGIFNDLVNPEDTLFHATFIKKDKEGYLVSLYDNTVPLIQKMFQIMYSSPGAGAVTTSSAARRSTRSASRESSAAHHHPHIPLPSKDQAQISHARDPTLLFLHCERDGETRKTVEHICNMLEQHAQRGMQPLRIKQVGQLCAVKYTDDDMWYRGVIVAVHGDHVQVQFIDYGNEEDKRGGDIYELDRELSSIPAQSSPCQLAGIAEPPAGWADAAAEMNLCEEYSFTLKVVDPNTNPPTVELFHSQKGMSLAMELIGMGYGIDPTRQSIAMPQVPQIEKGTFQAKVAYADYPGRVYIQKVAEYQRLDDLLEALAEDYGEAAKNGTLPRLDADLRIGTVCCAQYSDDEQFYRAFIHGITRSAVKIQFIDFGNSEDKNPSQLYKLKEEYNALPAQAIECSLHGCTTQSNEWTPKMQEFFEETVLDKTYNCSILGRQGDGYVVKLEDMRSAESLADVVNRYVSSGGASAQGFGAPQANNAWGGVQAAAAPVSAPAPTPAPTERAEVKIDWPPRIDKFDHVDAMISFGEGPEDFWVNLVDPQDKLGQLDSKMQEVYANGGTGVPRVFRYMYIAAKSPDDNRVYRAKTLNNDRDMPTLVYVDYGNEEDVPRDNLYLLEPYLATVLPCQAVHCALNDVARLKPEGVMKEELVKKFEELVNDQNIRIKNICPAQREKPHNEIEVLVGGENVLDILEKELIALSGPPDVPVCAAQIGSVVKGMLVNITSATDFWVQLAGPISKINEMTKVCTDNMTEPPEVDTYCAVVLGDEDDTVYRAKVKSVESGNVTVVCIDYGYTRTLTMKNVYKLKQSCGDEPAQAFPCALPLSVTPENEAAVMQTLNTLSEKCVTVKLYSKQDDRFTVDFHPVDHVTLFTPAATSTLPALTEVAGVYQLQQIDPEHTYYVSYPGDLSQFYVQKSDLDMDELAKTVADACAASPKPIPFPSRGTVCVAKDSKYSAWNRAIVTDICEGDMINILFLDYGSSETVRKSTVKELPESLHSLPVAAIKCSLSPLPEDYLNFTELFETVTNERELSIVPTEDGGVTVTVDGCSLSEVFEKATHYSTLKFSQPELKQTSNVNCTSIEDPFNIWVQLVEYEEKLGTVMEALAEYCPEAPALYTHSTGTVCAALYPDDNTWYRAEITNEGAEKCTVKFVDYGNSCEVDKASLKLLPEEHLDMPANSVLVRLAHCRPKSGAAWDGPAIDKLFELTDGEVCEMKLTSKRALQHVTLSFRGIDVASQGMDEVATLTPDPDILTIPDLTVQEGETKITITHVEQVNQIYGILSENFDAAMGLSDLSENLVTVDQPFKPLVCMAKWMDALYRAIILDFNATEADVWFVDFGNKDKVKITDLWYLNPEHVELPAQAIPLQLDGVKPVKGGEWSEEAKTALNSQIADMEVTVKLPALEGVTVSSPASLVEMTVEEVSVSETLKSKKMARSLVQPPVVTSYTPHEFGEEVAVYCTEVNVKEEGGVSVTCQLAGEKVNEIQNLLQESISEGHPDYVPEEITEGLVCTTRFSEDNSWYRAEVTNIQGDKITVKFVDYGNSETKRRSEIQLLPEQLDSPTQMITVSLAGTDKMSDVDKNFLPKMMVLDAELIMKHSGDEASFLLVENNEEGEEIKRSDVVDMTIEHSTAVGSYPAFPALVAEGVVYSVQIDSPSVIFAQQDGCEELLETIGAMLVEHEPSKTVTSAPFVGQPVLAVFQGALYRATVLEVIDGSKCKVRFVDYGNTSLVDTVYDITPEQVAHPPQAIRLALQQFTQAPEKTLADTTKMLNTLLTEKEISIVECETSEKRVSESVAVTLSVEGVNVRLSLLQQGLCADPDASVGEYTKTNIPMKPVEVEVTHVEHETLFFASRTGGEVVELDEDDPVPEPDPTDTEELVSLHTYVEEMQTVLDDDSGRPPVLDSSSVEVGTLCVTRWEEASGGDGVLYRAVVLWVQHDYAKVRFIDYGNTYYTSLSKILDCPEPYRGPGLAVPFIGQINEKPVTADTHYLVEKTGADEGAGISVTVALPLPKLHKYKYTKPEMNTPFTGYVSAALPHGHFFAQLETATETLETLAPLIAGAAAAKTQVPDLVPGAPVLGLYNTDNLYYRGKVTEVIKDGVAKVLFVDYGNTETCTSMYNVTPEIMEIRVVGINCQINGTNWVGVEAKPIYDEHIVLDNELTITPLSYDKDQKQFSVSVSAGEDVDVGAAVCEANVPVSEKKYTVEKRNFPTNLYQTLYCSNLNSVQDVCLQEEADFELIEQIGTETEAATKVQLLSAEPGNVCLVKDPKDGAYYRGQITSVTEDKYSVHYVDYGNRETVPISSLFDIPVSLTQHKVCGIHCNIAATKTPEGGFEASNTDKLKKLCDPNTPLSVSVYPATEGEVISVSILLGNNVLRNHVQEEALVELPEKYNCPVFTEETVLLTSVANTPADFYGQRAEDEGRLGVLATLIAEKANQTENLADPQPGQACIARLADDEQLYRACVTSVEDDKVTVLYVDYGNSEQVELSALYPVPNSLLSIPLLAVPLSLSAITTPPAWSEETLTKLSEVLYQDCEIKVTPVSWTEEGRCQGKVLADGVCVKSALGELVENTDPDWVPEEVAPAAEPAAANTPAAADTPSYTYQKLDDGPSVVYVSHPEGPTDFSVQKEEWGAELETLQEQVRAAETPVLTAPTPGTPCLANSAELGDKYRAEVVAVTETGVTVRYVDYGNQETITAENVFTIPDSLLTPPVLAVPCSLPGTLSPAAHLSFLELVQPEAEVTVTPISWSESGRLVCTCKLECGGADITATLSSA